MVNHSVNESYNNFIFKTDALPQDMVFQLDIAATLFNNLIPNVRDLLISEGAKVPPRPSTETNHHGNHRILLVRNAEIEAEKKIRAIRAAVKTEI